MRMPEFDFPCLRGAMVRQQLIARGITDQAVLRVMGELPRERFVEPIDWDEAYEDHPLGIACDQTISQPYIVALMTQMLELRPGLRVLEVGTGSGYQAAVLAALGAQVWSIERHAQLSELANRALVACQLAEKVQLQVGDGSEGWPENAPYDRMILTCCAPGLPPVLTAQLAEGGLLVAPVQQGEEQRLQLVRKENGKLAVTESLPVLFVPLIGRYGFPH